MIRFKKQFPLVLQDEIAECGLACLAMILRHFGKCVTLEEMRSQADRYESGMTLRALVDLARAHGLQATPYRIELEGLRELRTPAILHWEMSHYVVMVEARRRGLLVHDPARGARQLSWNEVSKRFTGVAVAVEPTAAFQTQPFASRPGYFDLLRGIHGLRGLLLQAVLLTAILQAAVFLGPRYLQQMIDNVVRADRDDLALTIAGGFFAIAVIAAAAQVVRALVVTSLAGRFRKDAKAAYVRKLLALPSAFFHKRRTADVVARIQSLEVIQDQTSTASIEAVVDAVAIIVASALILNAAHPLGLVTIGTVAVLVAVRELMHGKIVHAGREAVIAQTTERSSLHDTVATIEQLKALGRVAGREERWRSLNEVAAAATERFDRASAIDDCVRTSVPGLLLIVWVFAGIEIVVSGRLSLGEFYALLAYNSIALVHSQSLVRTLRDFRLLRLHFERIQDTLDAKAETLDVLPMPQNFDIRINNLSFRYSGESSAILKDVNLVIPEGACIGIEGRSGAGKSTFAKLVLGLVEPTEGSVTICDQSATSIRCSQLADRVVGFLQNDSSLFEGSVLDNVTLFCPDADDGRVERLLEAVRLISWVDGLPLGMHTVITSPRQVSGGQLQRLMLARALYQCPRILILDESTSNLDTDTELEVIKWIRTQRMTCILISHRAEALAQTDRLLTVERAVIRERERVCKIPA